MEENEKTPNKIFKECCEWWAGEFDEFKELSLSEKLREWNVSACDVSFAEGDGENEKSPYDLIRDAFYEMLNDVIPSSIYESFHGEDYWMGRVYGDPVVAGWCDGFSVWYQEGGEAEKKLRPWIEKIDAVHERFAG